MNYDIHQSISEGSLRAQDEENRRLGEIANELRRLCKLYEKQCRESQPHASPLDIEMRVAETYAKEHHIWLPMEKIFDLGVPGPSGNENDTYVSEDSVFKVNNLLNCGSILKLLEKTRMHNAIFPETYYRLYGFTGFEGRSVYPVLQQRRVANSEPAPQVAIDTYMAALGFNRQEEAGRYANGTYVVWDLLPRNVLRDSDGDIYVVDAEIRRI